MLEIPILFLIYNRPNTTAKVFERIRQIKPKQLFVAADGSRDSIHELQLCNETRAIIDRVDWHCDVKTLFRNNNLGCAKAVSSAITWFFEYVEEGIILEDDCLPDSSFFSFCDVMLKKYREEETVMLITGTNTLYDSFKKDNNSYFFSAHSAIWGWATWRRAWNKFSLNIDGWKTIEPQLNRRIDNPDFCEWLMNMFQSVEDRKVNSWAIPWWYHFQLNNGLCITPNGNLIQNIGYTGTHYRGGFRHPVLQMPIIKFNLKAIKHPKNIIINSEKDNIMFNHIMKPHWGIYDRLYNRLLRNLFRLEEYLNTKIK
jgi:hypothetical protein